MNLSAKTEYACLAMLELAQHSEDDRPVQVRRIAERHGIPSPFLVQILQDLKRAGLVKSTRGASGGYRLSGVPQEITLVDVLDAVEASEEPTTSAAATSPLAPVLLDVCQELSAARRARLQDITLAQLLEKAHSSVGPMWYI
jgi:Rrf2 family protein